MQSALIEELLQPKAPEQFEDFDDFEAPKRSGDRGDLNLDEFRRKPTAKRKQLGASRSNESQLLSGGRKRTVSLENEDEFFLATAGLDPKRYAAQPRGKRPTKVPRSGKPKVSDSESESATEDEEMIVDEDEQQEEDNVAAVSLSKKAKLESVSLINETSSKRTDGEQATAVRAQFDLFDALLELRISLHSLSGVANTLPKPDTFEQFVLLSEQRESDPNRIVMLVDDATSENAGIAREADTTKQRLAEARRSLVSLIGKLIQVDDVLSGCEKTDQTRLANCDDFANHKKFAAMAQQIESLLHERLEQFREERDDVLTSWQQRTRLGSSFGKFERPVADQIATYANDSQSLQRTRLRRSAYRVLGTVAAEADADAEGAFRVAADQLMPSARRTDAAGQQYDAEIFDDDDFYQKQIREFLALNALAGGDAQQGGGQSHAALLNELDVAKKRRKVRQVDTRASKARRLRFTVHPKLVNFLAPVLSITDNRVGLAAVDQDDQPTTEWTDDKRQALFSALFRSSSDADQ